MKKSNFYMVLLCIIMLLLFVSCADNSSIDMKEEIKHIEQEAYDMEKTEADSLEAVIQKICKRIEQIDFSVQKYSINTEAYDPELDKKYKEAFLKAITNEAPLFHANTEESYFRESVFGAGGNATNEEYLEFIKSSGFHYLDFDGDGLPELVVEPGFDLHVLKYIPEEDKVYGYIFQARYWNLLGCGQLYYFDNGSAGITRYGYKAYDETGEEIEHVLFEIWHDSNEYVVMLEDSEYEKLGIDENILIDHTICRYVVIDKENWYRISKKFFESVNNALPGMTFDEVFGDIAVQ